MADAFATPEELAAYLQRDLDRASAELALDLASGMIRGYTRRTLSRVEDDVVTLVPTLGYLRLPNRPVVEVAALADDDGPISEDAWTRSADLLFPVSGIWTKPITVTYTHGYASIPDDIKAVCLALASRSMGNPNDLRSEAVGGESVTYATETLGAASLGAPERAALSRYRRTLATVEMRAPA